MSVNTPSRQYLRAVVVAASNYKQVVFPIYNAVGPASDTSIGSLIQSYSIQVVLFCTVDIDDPPDQCRNVSPLNVRATKESTLVLKWPPLGFTSESG